MKSNRETVTPLPTVRTTGSQQTGGIARTRARIFMPSDGQSSNFGILESEVVAKLNRAPWKGAADLGCNNYLVAHMREISRLGVRFVFRSRSVYPPFDCSAAILVPLIGYESIVGKERDEVIRFTSIGRLEKGGDGRRKLYIHGVRFIPLFVRPNRCPRGREKAVFLKCEFNL